MYRSTDVAHPETRCSQHSEESQELSHPEEIHEHETASEPRGNDPPILAATAQPTTRIAFDTDVEYVLLFGRDPAAVVGDIEGLMNLIEELFERDTGVTFEVTTIIVRDVPIGLDPYSAADAGGLLGEMTNHWNLRQGGIMRAAAHMMTGKVFTGDLGASNERVICRPLDAYAVARTLFTPNTRLRVARSGHRRARPRGGLQAQVRRRPRRGRGALRGLSRDHRRARRHPRQRRLQPRQSPTSTTAATRRPYAGSTRRSPWGSASSLTSCRRRSSIPSSASAATTRPRPCSNRGWRSTRAIPPRRAPRTIPWWRASATEEIQPLAGLGGCSTTCRPRRRRNSAAPQQRGELLKKYVADELLWRKAVKLEYDKDPQVRRSYEALLKQLAISKFVEQEVVTQIEVDPADLQNFFEANRARYEKEGENLEQMPPEAERDYRMSKGAVGLPAK